MLLSTKTAGTVTARSLLVQVSPQVAGKVGGTVSRPRLSQDAVDQAGTAPLRERETFSRLGEVDSDCRRLPGRVAFLPLSFCGTSHARFHYHGWSIKATLHFGSRKRNVRLADERNDRRFTPAFTPVTS
jgi:hypothetical protein